MKKNLFTLRTQILGFALISVLIISCSKTELPRPAIQKMASQTNANACEAAVEGSIDVINENLWVPNAGRIDVYTIVGIDTVLVGSGLVNGKGSGGKELFYGEVIDNPATLLSPCIDVPLQVGVTYYLCPSSPGSIFHDRGAYYGGFKSQKYLVVRFTSANHGKLKFQYRFDPLASYNAHDIFILDEVGANIQVHVENRTQIILP